MPVTITTSGNGCAHNTVDISGSSATSQFITGQLKDFSAELSPTSNQKDQSRNCNFMVQVTYPAGMKFTIQPSNFEGYARLDPGVQGKFFQSFYFSGNAMVTYDMTYDISGDGFRSGANFIVPGEKLRSDTLWSKCGGQDIVTLSSRVALSYGDGADRESATGSINAGLAANQTVTLVWTYC